MAHGKAVKDQKLSEIKGHLLSPIVVARVVIIHKSHQSMVFVTSYVSDRN